jgi:N-acetylglucosamine repressor
MQYDGGINRDVQKEANLALVIRALHADPAATRVGLARATGLKQATITKIVRQLQQWDLVSQTTRQHAPMGRKPMGLALNADKFLLGAVRVNRFYLSCAVCDLAGRVRVMAQKPNRPEMGAAAALQALKALVGETLARADRPVIGLGAALPGPFNARTKRITLMSGFPGWADIDIERGLSEAAGVPVFLEHDANCGALAELWYGAHRRDENLLYIVCDRGVGAGLITGGAIYHGANGYSGEIGHASIDFAGPLCECGNRGCLELYASSEALKQTYARSRPAAPGAASQLDTAFNRATAFEPNTLSKPGAASEPSAVFESTTTPKPDTLFNPDAASESGAPDSDQILSLVRRGDPAAVDAYRRVVSHLAFGVAGLINTLNPDCVVFADRMTLGGDVFLDTMRSVLKRRLMPEIFSSLRLSVNSLPGDPMLLGAGVVALDNLLKRPSGAFGRAASGGKDEP